MTDELSFSDWLSDKLHEHKMTQKDLAVKSGLGKSAINKLVRRMVKRPDPQTYVAIAKALDVSPITVLRIAGILPPDPDFPELEDLKSYLSQLSPYHRKLAVELVKTVLRQSTETDDAKGGKQKELR